MSALRHHIFKGVSDMFYMDSVKRYDTPHQHGNVMLFPMTVTYYWHTRLICDTNNWRIGPFPTCSGSANRFLKCPQPFSKHGFALTALCNAVNVQLG